MVAPAAKAIGFRCCYCRAPMLPPDLPPTREHAMPRSRFSPVLTHADKGKNICFACGPCNLEKGSSTLLEFLAYLIERQDHRAANVAGLIRSYAKRGLFHLCAVYQSTQQSERLRGLMRASMGAVPSVGSGVNDSGICREL